MLSLLFFSLSLSVLSQTLSCITLLACFYYFIPQRTIHKHSEATLNFPQISFCRFHYHISTTITTNFAPHSAFSSQFHKITIIIISISKLDILSGFQDYIFIKIPSKFLSFIPSLEALSYLQSTNAGVVAANLPPNSCNSGWLNCLSTCFMSYSQLSGQGSTTSISLPCVASKGSRYLKQQ